MTNISTILQVRVSPSASKTRLIGRHAKAWKLSVSAAPERGKANQAVKAMLARELNIPVSDIVLLRGETSRDKQFRIAELDAEELAQRLALALAPKPQ